MVGSSEVVGRHLDCRWPKGRRLSGGGMMGVERWRSSTMVAVELIREEAGPVVCSLTCDGV
jgi:hypothetical protein